MISNRQSAIAKRQSRAFTLIELLVVIGIILILIGILLPVVNQVRVAAQTTNTRQMIARIEAGIQAYYSDFQSYPGPFLNQQLVPFQTTAPRINELDSGSPQLNVGPVTSTENLYLGLAGGLSYNGAVFEYSDTLAGNLNGPGNLNVAKQKRYQAYITLDATETTLKVENEGLPGTTTGPNGLWVPASAGITGDTIVPEILDKYARPAPVLYLRAVKGAPGMLNPGATYDAGSQYQTRMLTDAYVGTVRYNSTTAMDAPWSNWVGSEFPASGTLGAGLPAYLGNPSVSSAVATPHKKDEFILISAGPDGKYGTRDDVTNFR